MFAALIFQDFEDRLKFLRYHHIPRRKLFHSQNFQTFPLLVRCQQLFLLEYPFWYPQSLNDPVLGRYKNFDGLTVEVSALVGFQFFLSSGFIMK